jgi:type I restriction enzyme S subunit
MSRLPAGWANSTLSTASYVVRGITFPASAKEQNNDKSNVCCLRTSNIQREITWSNVYFVSRSYVKRPEQFVQNGDVLMSMANSYELVGKVAVVRSMPQLAAFGAFLAAIRPTAAIDGRYLFHFLRTNRIQSELRQGSSQTTNIANISVATLSAVEIPLAPLAEQKRIVEKLDLLLARADACRARLDGISLILLRFRQSILRAAISGKLSEDWAKTNESRINVQEEFLAITKIRGGERVRKIEPTSNHDILLPHFPERWRVGIFDSFFNFLDYRGRTPTKAASGKRLITAKNIKMGLVQDEPVEYVSNEAYVTWMTRGFPRVGDIFFVTEGHTMGCVAVNNRTDEFALAQRTITLQPIGRLHTRFYAFYMLSMEFQRLVDINATGTAARGIKASKLRGLPAPFPSLEEQAEIVRRVEMLFAFADRLEERLANVRAATERLTPALLAKAFRGELVSQDSQDEPARELLMRLAAQGATTPKPNRNKPPKRRTD